MARAERRQGRRWPGALFRWGPVVLVVLVFGAATASYHFDLGTRWFGAPATNPTTPTTPAPGLTLPTPSPLRPVARPALETRPAASDVRRALAQALTDPHLARLRAVVAPLQGSALLDVGHGASMPASTLKLLTVTAALHVLGPDHTFATRVVAQGRHSITLVGGGDPFLADRAPKAGASSSDASLQALARRTAGRLKATGVTRVSLAYDASLFSGPRVNPHWPTAYVTDQVVSPITALWADEGVAADHSRRVTDPAATAAADFAAYLTKDGVTVHRAPLDHAAPRHARELATVSSVPLSDIVERVLQTSDNEGAEVLAHQVGLAVSGDGSFAGGVKAVEQTLRALGIDLRGARLYDGSGLSRHDRLDARTLVQVLQLAATPDHPELRPVLTGLPVASFTGSLQGRFTHSTGRGWVRAKTGTLSGTSALAGLGADVRGRVLVFAFVSNHVPVAGTLDAQAALDHLAAALSACRC